MSNLRNEHISGPRDKMSMDLSLLFADSGVMAPCRGDVIILMEDARTGEVLHEEVRKNIITLDAGILAAILFRDSASRRGVNMLAVGTGATGSLLSPNAPDARQRKLNAEIARKPFSSTTFRDANGNAVAIPTSIVDFTCVFDEGEAVGPLTEMGLLSTISANPAITNPNPDNFPTRDLTRDLTLYDILVNYLTFGVITKPSTARLSFTWRLTFGS